MNIQDFNLAATHGFKRDKNYKVQLNYLKRHTYNVLLAGFNVFLIKTKLFVSDQMSYALDWHHMSNSNTNVSIPWYFAVFYRVSHVYGVKDDLIYKSALLSQMFHRVTVQNSARY